MEFVTQTVLWCLSGMVVVMEGGSVGLERYWKELLWLAGGVLVWMVTEPLRGVVIRLFSETGFLLYKWVGLTMLCTRLYRRYVRGLLYKTNPTVLNGGRSTTHYGLRPWWCLRPGENAWTVWAPLVQVTRRIACLLALILIEHVAGRLVSIVKYW